MVLNCTLCVYYLFGIPISEMYQVGTAAADTDFATGTLILTSVLVLELG